MSVTRILEALDFATAYVNKMEAEIATLRAVHAEAMELLREVDELLESVEKMEGALCSPHARGDGPPKPPLLTARSRGWASRRNLTKKEN